MSGIEFANVGQHSVTNTKCIDYCDQAGYIMAGTEFGGQCFCSSSLIGSSSADASACNTPCEGDGSQTCGGSLTLSVFSKSTKSKRREAFPHRHLNRHLQKLSH
jgi:hypothetical protein